MFSYIQRLFSPPDVGADTHTFRIARQLYLLTLLLLSATVFAWLLLLTIAGAPLLRLLISVPIPVVLTAVLVLLRQRRILAGSLTLVVGMWLALVSVAIWNDGVFSPAYHGLTIVTLCAGLLLGRRAAIICAGASIIAGLLLVAGSRLGYMMAYPVANGPIDTWIASAIFFLSAAAVLPLATNSIAALLQGAERELEERRRVEARLREREADLARSEGRLRSLVTAIPDLALVLDTSGRYLDVFTGSDELLFQPRDAIIGRSIAEILPDDVASRGMETIAQAVGDGAVHAFEYSLPIGERTVHFQARVVSFREGDELRLLWLARDISEQAQTLDLLRTREEVYRQAITAADAVPYYLDYPTYSYTYMSENITKILGYPVEEVTPDLLDRLEVATIMRGPAAELGAEEAILMARRGDLAIWRCDSLMRTRAGELRWLADSSVQVFDPNHHVVGAFGILQDITERKRTEEQLHQAQKLQAIGQLAGGLSHDFNNLLTIIMNYTDVLIEQASAERLPEWLTHDLEQIRHAGMRAATLTRQLLAFSRRQVLDLRVRDLNQIVREILPMLERLVGSHISVQTRLAPDLGAVRADASQIEQVIINLAVNARDAMPRGGRLLIETANLHIDQAFAVRRAEVQPGDYVALSVGDDGLGMDEETQAHVFEPFFTTKEPGHGTGLGLATAHGIVTQSGGRIWFESEPGRGTTFTICLPLAAVPGEADEHLSAPQPPPSGHETILLVEDDVAVRQITGLMLQRVGYRVIMASPDEAERIGGDPTAMLDLLLTDVVMPGIDGVELARRLVALRPGLRVMFMSGYTDSVIVQPGVGSGSAIFLQKPFAPGALIAKVREALDSRAAPALRPQEQK